MKSLSELESSADVGRPERDFPICVSGKLAAELEAADRDMFEAAAALEAEREKAKDRDGGDGPPRRAGQRGKIADLEKKATEAAEKCDAIRSRMEEHTVILHLRSKTNGEWRQWASVHPAREEDDDKAGAARDQRHAGGWCDIDALIADLPEYVAKYGDEDPSDRWKNVVFGNAAPGDLTRLASVVVGMHEQVVDAGKPRGGWLLGRMS